MYIFYVQYSMLRQENFEYFNIIVVEKQWLDVQLYEWRLLYYCIDFELIMIQCWILFQVLNVLFGSGLFFEVDFQFLYMVLKDVRRRVEFLSSSIIGLVGMVGNRQVVEEQVLSRQEVMSVKVLMVVGLVFILFGFVVSLFGMEDWFVFGGERFWMYWVVVVLVSVVVFGLYFFVKVVRGGGMGKCRVEGKGMC